MASKAQLIFTFLIAGIEYEAISFREAAKKYFKRHNAQVAIVRRKCDEEVAVIRIKNNNVSYQKKII